MRRVLGVDPRFNRVPVQGNISLADGQLLPRGDPDLPLDQIPSGHHLGDRMLDLQPGVHLHEEELVGPVSRNDELDRAGAGVIDASGGVARRGADPGPRRGIQQRRRRLFDDLLVSPLQAALPLAEVHHIAVGVSQHLNFDVPGAQHETLEKQGVVAERGGRLPAGTDQRGGQVSRSLDHPHPFAAATGRRLDQHRVADLVGGRDQVVVGEPRPAIPGTTGTPNADTVPLAAILSPMVWIAFTGGPMKVTPADARAAAKSAFSERNP